MGARGRDASVDERATRVRGAHVSAQSVDENGGVPRGIEEMHARCERGRDPQWAG